MHEMSPTPPPPLPFPHSLPTPKIPETIQHNESNISVITKQRQHQQRELTKQRVKNKQQLLSELITPLHIPSKCHANVEPMVELLREIQLVTKTSSTIDTATTTDLYNDTPNDDDNDNDELRPGLRPSFTTDKWDKTQHPCSKASFPFIYRDNRKEDDHRRPPTPLSQIQSVQHKCEIYLYRAKDFRRRAHSIAVSLKEMDEDEGAEDTGFPHQQQPRPPYSIPSSASTSAVAAVAIATRRHRTILTQTQSEYLTRSKMQELNYRYCLGHTTCPQRADMLHGCWNRTSPEATKTLIQSGRGGWICREEKLAVERCCGDLVKGVMQNTLQH